MSGRISQRQRLSTKCAKFGRCNISPSARWRFSTTLLHCGRTHWVRVARRSSPIGEAAPGGRAMDGADVRAGKPSLAEEAYAAIRAAILRLDLAPGEQVTESQ